MNPPIVFEKRAREPYRADRRRAVRSASDCNTFQGFSVAICRNGEARIAQQRNGQRSLSHRRERRLHPHVVSLSLSARCADFARRVHTCQFKSLDAYT